MQQDEEDEASGAQSKALEASLTNLMTALHKGTADEAAPHGLSPLEFNLLRACMERNECTATQLAEILPVDASRISRVVTRLVDRGLLRRRRLRSDRRIVMLRLTADGDEMTAAISERVNAYGARLVEGVSEAEMDVFMSVTSKILDNYSALSAAE